ncbi:MAG TPA: deaminase, partial [Candidatus Paceibacterota bacterium]
VLHCILIPRPHGGYPSAMRPTREATLMAIATVIAARGTCDRKQVGAVIAREGRPISWGFNGAPPGLPHCSENGHGWGEVDNQEGLATLRTMLHNWPEIAKLSDAELARMPWDWRGGVEYLAKLRGCRNATHAEANALAFAARQGISTDGAELFVTVAPCATCARLLIAAGIVRVYYQEAYRDGSGVELLRQAGIPTYDSDEAL